MDIREACEKVKYEQLSPQWQEIVDYIGMEAFIKLCFYYGGASYSIPLFSNLMLGQRDREIQRNFTGRNYKELASQFRLSERQIRKILHGTRT